MLKINLTNIDLTSIKQQFDIFCDLIVDIPIKLLSKNTIVNDNKLVYAYLLTLAYFGFINNYNQFYLDLEALLVMAIKQEQIEFDVTINKFNYSINSLISYGIYKCNNINTLATLFMLTINKNYNPLPNIIRFYLKWYKQDNVELANNKLQTFLCLIFNKFQKHRLDNFYLQFLYDLNSKDQTNLTKFTNHFTTKLQPYLQCFSDKNSDIDLTKLISTLISIESLIVLALEFNHHRLLTVLKDNKEYKDLANAMLMDPIYQCYQAIWQKDFQLDDFDNYKYSSTIVLSKNYLVAALAYNKRKDLTLFADHFSNHKNEVSDEIKRLNAILEPKEANIDHTAFYCPQDFEKLILNNAKLVKTVRIDRLQLLNRLLYTKKTGRNVVNKVDKINKIDNKFLKPIDGNDSDYGSDDGRHYHHSNYSNTPSDSSDNSS